VTDDEILMRLALDEASAAADRGDPGFGAVVARAGQTVAQASSTEVTHRNPLAHDGLAVLGEARRRLGKSDLSGCTFYGTAEPCPMCSAVILIIWRSWTASPPPGSRRGAAALAR
jgi:tRNA(Arg) A34 adenosine deaminase TadA